MPTVVVVHCCLCAATDDVSNCKPLQTVIELASFAAVYRRTCYSSIRSFQITTICKGVEGKQAGSLGVSSTLNALATHQIHRCNAQAHDRELLCSPEAAQSWTDRRWSGKGVTTAEHHVLSARTFNRFTRILNVPCAACRRSTRLRAAMIAPMPPLQLRHRSRRCGGRQRPAARVSQWRGHQWSQKGQRLRTKQSRPPLPLPRPWPSRSTQGRRRRQPRKC